MNFWNENFKRGMERIMFGISWRDRKRASWIREQTKVEDILTTIKIKSEHGKDTSGEEEIIV